MNDENTKLSIRALRSAPVHARTSMVTVRAGDLRVLLDEYDRLSKWQSRVVEADREVLDALGLPEVTLHEDVLERIEVLRNDAGWDLNHGDIRRVLGLKPGESTLAAVKHLVAYRERNKASANEIRDLLGMEEDRGDVVEAVSRLVAYSTAGKIEKIMRDEVVEPSPAPVRGGGVERVIVRDSEDDESSPGMEVLEVSYIPSGRDTRAVYHLGIGTVDDGYDTRSLDIIAQVAINASDLEAAMTLVKEAHV